MRRSRRPIVFPRELFGAVESRLRRDRRVVLRIATEILGSLDATLVPETRARLLTKMRALARRWSAYCVAEERWVYAPLLTHDDPTVAVHVTRVRQEMDELCGWLARYADRWLANLASVDPCNDGDLVVETRALLGTLSKRVALEDDELYRLRDELGDLAHPK